jgi:uncharacterized protein
MELNVWQWTLGLLGSFLVGLGKAGVPGIANMAVVIYALIFTSAKASVGILVPILICGDVASVIIYRRYAHWKFVWMLLPWTICGVVIGFFAIDWISDKGIRQLIGISLVSMTLLHFCRKWQLKRLEKNKPDTLPHSPWFVGIIGVGGGFSTMVANAAGPVASLFFLAVGLRKMVFIGTIAWFFLIVNLIKVPFQVTLGIINTSSLALSLKLASTTFLGAMIAPYIVKYIDQKMFDTLVWFFIVLSGLKLLF